MASNAANALKHSLQYLESLQSWQLRQLCNAIGISTGTKKSATAAALVHTLTLHNRFNGSSRNIKSVDMGVKNLAYCLLQPADRGSGSTTLFRIADWRRLNVVTGESTAVDEEVAEDTPEDETPALTNLYSPANLAPIAAKLATRLATDLDPAFVLIERQRYRSLGGAAVQEWTLRVNSLEMMLWASLQTMRDRSGEGFPATVEMNPARIAAYWNARGSDWSLDASEDNEEIIPQMKKSVDLEVAAKRGMEKAAKIGLLRHWLEHGALDVDQRLLPLANAFMTVGRAKKGEGDLVLGKKDDLADCVVQGVTFGIWSRNRSLLARHLEREVHQ